MTTAQRNTLTKALAARFAKHTDRHAGIQWSAVQARLDASPAKLDVLHKMEETGGEPDVIGRDDATGGFVFCDCSPESPAGRRSLCYDKKALDARKANKPTGSALETASSMGIEMLNEQEYRALQELGKFDRKTSSWVRTPAPIRALGGAIFCDRRYDTVFVYHNGADSYYAARGFRGRIVI